MSDGPDLDQLADRARGGDADAFAALYDALAPRLARYVRSRVRDPDDAADLVQQVFLKMVEALPRYESRGVPFTAWAFRLTRNAVIDRARTLHPSDPLEFAADEASPEPSPEHLALISAERTRIERAMHDLTDEQQEVLRLRFFGGLGPREVGALMGRRDGAVRALQFRALEALRHALATEDER
jgi:RNA polymerase sigma-70 factor, ECF subfamily